MNFAPLDNKLAPEQIIARTDELIVRAERNPRELLEYNCFGALSYVVGAQSQLTCPLSMREMGERMSLSEAMNRFKVPFVFQLHGGYSVPDGMGGWEFLDGVVHAGLVLGTNLDGKVGVFEKFGPTGPVRKLGWDEMVANFLKEPPLPNEYSRFLSVEDFRKEQRK